jgi:hypothetical protein
MFLTTLRLFGLEQRQCNSYFNKIQYRILEIQYLTSTNGYLYLVQDYDS